TEYVRFGNALKVFCTIKENDDENDYTENSQDKNQKFPVVVCVVCAIICVLALLAILFIAPMRFNSFDKNQLQDLAQEKPQDFSSEKTVSELPPPPPEPVAPIAPPAKEDEIVVITETKNVVPDFPPPQEKKSEPKEIVYKIKWGDTLWDLSATYYKNPWLYPKIAHYNNIKNPNYIVAGSTIRIPEE
ncbi:MAG: LysM peptidoglycan-binding domain-containing protein, partial [Treponemataceae bacterium]|nr:LysM peptidoglycan-binding domain-containing protein [Treponemataceae bacterium]